jgi:putative ABC transport system substrate-binding protein
MNMKIDPKTIAGILIGVVLVGAAIYFLMPKKAEEKVYRVGVLSGLDFFADTADGFKAKMTELGYIEGKNIVYDIQKTNVDMVSYRNILKKFVEDKVDLIFTFPTEASMEAKAATQGTGIPVVFTNAFTEGTSLVNSIREPGGNITGVRWAGPDLALQRFEIMHELVPNAKRMWIPYQKGYPIVKSQLEALRPAFAAANLTMIELPADNATELEAKLQEQAQSFNNKTDVILMIAEPLCVTPDPFKVMAKFATGHGIPVGGAFMSMEGYASLFGVTPQSIPQGRQAAFLADQILRGTPAGTIPVVSAESFLQIDYKVAQELGIAVPESLLNRADEIIR